MADVSNKSYSLKSAADPNRLFSPNSTNPPPLKRAKLDKKTAQGQEQEQKEAVQEQDAVESNFSPQ